MANRTIGTALKLQGEKEFNAQMKELNNGLKTTRSDMVALTASFDSNSASIKDLTSKQKILQSSVDQHKAKVAALKSQYEAAAATLGENSATTQKYRQQLNFATAALEKETAALEKNSDALRGKYLAGLKALASGAKNTFTGVGNAVGTSVGGIAKGVGVLTAASAVGVAAIGAGGMIAITTMANMAKEAAEAAKAAKEAGETLTDSQQKWLEFSGQMDSLDASVANAKSALGGVLLPILSELSIDGTAFLDSFSRDMEAAAGDTGKQGQVMAQYIAQGAKLIKDKLPEYIAAGKELFGGLRDGLSESGPELSDMGMDLVMDLLDSIIDNAPELAQAGMTLTQKLTESLIERGPELVTSSIGMVEQITVGLAQAAPQLIPAAAQLISQLLIALVRAAPDLLLAGSELIMKIVEGLIAAIDELIAGGDEVIDAAVEAFTAKADDFIAVGSYIVERIRTGASDAWDSLVSWFTGAWDSLFGNLNVNVGASAGVDGSHAGGLDYVPFDGYLAQLHRGEMVLASAEAAAYRRDRSAGSEKTPNIVNLTFNAKNITEADINMVVDIVNRKLGDDL